MPARSFDPGYDDSFGKSRILPPGYLETETTTREFKPAPSPAIDPPQRTIDGAVVPDSIHILGSDRNASRRIGNRERDRFLSHLHFLHDEGHLDEDEYNARVEFVNSAKTSAQLRVVLEDLPPLPEPTKKEQVKSQEKPYKTFRQRLGEPRAENAAAQIILCVFGAGLCLIPWFFTQKNVPLTYALATFSVIAGLGLLVGSIVWAAKSFNWG